VGELPFSLRKLYVSVEEVLASPEAAARGERPLRKAFAAAVVLNPHAGRRVEDLSELISWGEPLGELLGAEAVKALGGAAASYGKAAIVGTDGEQEHGVALLTTLFGDALRAQVGGGLAWISSATKRGPSGTAIDVPLAHKDALYVRDHYDAAEVRVPDAPLPDEIVAIAAVANRGRLDARCGGLSASEIEGRDGLR